MKRITFTLLIILILLAIVIPVSAATLKSQAFPYFNILAVEKDKSVTIEVFNFPADDSFMVTMGKNGTKGIGGVEIGTTDSGKGGSFKVTYKIPSSLSGLDIIAIRLESPTSGYYAYNWFSNSSPSTTSPTPAPSGTPASTYTGFPTFSIVSVLTDKSVTIKTNNLPPKDTFTVTMGKYGTLGVGGIEVAKTDSGVSGTMTVTYNIPTDLTGSSLIAIRMESPTSGYFAYNWFDNAAVPTGTAVPTPTATPSATPTSVGYSGFPTFTIKAVDQDKSVTISGINFPAEDNFTVLMGPFGTQGVKGENVGSTNTGSGGDLTKTYTIPADLAGSTRIAIRLESPTSGYFAYNWFWNSTNP